MRYLFGMIAAGALLGSASVANAQLSISIGNPYGGYGGYGGYSGYGGYGTGYYGMPYASSYSNYGSYSSYVAPGTTYFSSGYSGYTYPSVSPVYGAPVYGVPVYSPGYVPAYGYVSTYRYGPAYGYGYRGGIPGLNRVFGRYGLPY